MRFRKPTAYLLFVINFIGSMAVFCGNENTRYFFSKYTINRVSEKLNEYEKKSSNLKNMILFLSFGEQFYSRHSSSLIRQDAIELELTENEKSDTNKILSRLKENQDPDDEMLYDFTVIKSVSMRGIAENINNGKSVLFIDRNGDMMNIIGCDETAKTVLLFNSYFQEEIMSLNKLFECEGVYITRDPTSFNKAYIKKQGLYGCQLL